MKKSLIIFAKLLISGLLVFLVFKFSDLDIPKTIEQLKDTDLVWFAATSIFLSLNILTNAYRWNILAKLLGYDLHYGRAVSMYFQAMFSNNFLPTNFGGDAIRAFDLGREDKSWLKAASTILAERLFGFTMMYSLVPIGLLIAQFSGYNALLPKEVEIVLWLGFAALVLGLLSYKLWSKLPFGFIQKINFTINEYTKCHTSLKKVIVWTLITHILFIGAHICSIFAVGLDFNAIPWWYWLIMAPSATLVAFVIPSVKGVGAREASFIYFLSLLGVSSDKSLSIAFLTFLATLISTLPGVSIVFRKGKLEKTIEEEEEHEAEDLELLKQNSSN